MAQLITGNAMKLGLFHKIISPTGKTSYLYGTAHIEAQILPQAEVALHEASFVCVEANIISSEYKASQITARTNLAIQNQYYIFQNDERRHYALISKLKEHALFSNLRTNILSRLPPQVLMLYMLASLSPTNVYKGCVLDIRIVQCAGYFKPILTLESGNTVEELITDSCTPREAEKFVEYMLDNKLFQKAYREQCERSLADYQAGYVPSAELLWSVPDDISNLISKVNNTLASQRDKMFSDKMDHILEERNHGLFTFGAGHLPGVIKHLSQKGYQVEEVDDHEKLIAANPKNTQAYRDRASVNMALGSYEAAIADYDMVIQLDPQDGHAYYNRGVCNKSLGCYKEAIADYGSAIQLDPTDAQAYNNRGLNYNNFGCYEEAIADYESAIQRDPANTKIYTKNITDARENELNAQAAKNHFNSGCKKYHQGKFKEALVDFDRSIQLKSDDPAVYSMRGMTKTALKRYSDSIGDYSQAIRLNYNDPDLYQNRALAQYNNKYYIGSLSDFNRAIALEPKNAAFYKNRAKAHYKCKDIEASTKDCIKMMVLSDEDNFDKKLLPGIQFNLLPKIGRQIIDEAGHDTQEKSTERQVNEALKNIYSAQLQQQNRLRNKMIAGVCTILLFMATAVIPLLMISIVEKSLRPKSLCNGIKRKLFHKIDALEMTIDSYNAIKSATTLKNNAPTSKRAKKVAIPNKIWLDDNTLCATVKKVKRWEYRRSFLEERKQHLRKQLDVKIITNFFYQSGTDRKVKPLLSGTAKGVLHHQLSKMPKVS